MRTGKKEGLEKGKTEEGDENCYLLNNTNRLLLLQSHIHCLNVEVTKISAMPVQSID